MFQYPYDGPAMVSTGQRVRIVALGNVEAVGLGEPGRRRQKNVNATANTTDVVKVKMSKGFRFGAKARSAELVA